MWKASSALLSIACGCGSHAKPSAAVALGHALDASLAAADRARTPWRCAAPDTPPLAAEKLGAWQLAEHTVRGDADVIGVIADAGGSAPDTLAALGRLRGRFDEAHVQLVLALGGMGATRGELEATLGVLANHASYPIVALPGDLEPAGAQAAAIAALRARGDQVIDGRLARWIELPGAAIATIPGAGAQARLVAGADGCGYRKADLDHAVTELAARPGVRIAATAESPRERDSGELALATPGIDVELHGPTRAMPSPAASGARDGHATPLSPGTSDATTRVPEPHRPSAGVLAIHAGAWTWRPLVDSTR